ncbi:hypothetical protein [Spiroplasma endosymbiont of Nephrotoma flavescens]
MKSFAILFTCTYKYNSAFHKINHFLKSQYFFKLNFYFLFLN